MIHNQPFTASVLGRNRSATPASWRSDGRRACIPNFQSTKVASQQRFKVPRYCRVQRDGNLDAESDSVGLGSEPASMQGAHTHRTSSFHQPRNPPNLVEWNPGSR
ncbi:hypothetical protein Rhow_001051 [Rhodococcus wratislaviensis]|uniref:Uncharacterized protein n=1 Tax=Rhodococcus wratislaviensis TaxID=44752 RepID=A0A402CMR8_RHOWR|nr:hypothetical protein Rhow_001051 [Rhodococcus wratislaviensis]